MQQNRKTKIKMKETNKGNKGKAKNKGKENKPYEKAVGGGGDREGEGGKREGGGEVVLNWLRRRQKEKARICLGEQARGECQG